MIASKAHDGRRLLRTAVMSIAVAGAVTAVALAVSGSDAISADK